MDESGKMSGTHREMEPRKGANGNRTAYSRATIIEEDWR